MADELGTMSAQHMVGGVVAGLIGFLFSSKTILPIQNDMIGVLIGLILLYVLGKRAENKYGREKISMGSWIMNGILPYYCLCMIVWILLFNYIG